MTKTFCVMLFFLSIPAFADLGHEMRTYSNNHFEDASNLVNQIEEACKIDSANKSKLSRVKVIFIKRENLIYLANRVRAEVAG